MFQLFLVSIWTSYIYIYIDTYVSLSVSCIYLLIYVSIYIYVCMSYLKPPVGLGFRAVPIGQICGVRAAAGGRALHGIRRYPL